MSELIISLGGGGGLDTDECTAQPGDVLKGKTAGCSGFDDPVAGTLELTGSAADSQVLSGQTYYNTDAKTKRTGAMANRGAVSQDLNCGDVYTIPAGYHNGAGKVTANSLASQTDGATAGDGDVLAGKTFWKDGAKKTGAMPNHGAAAYTLPINGTYPIPAGYHNGAGYVNQNIPVINGDQWFTPTNYQQVCWCAGNYMTGNVAVAPTPGLAPENIKAGVTVGGVTGTYEGKWVYRDGTTGGWGALGASGATMHDQSAGFWWTRTGGGVVTRNPVQLNMYTRMGVEYEFYNCKTADLSYRLSRCTFHENGALLGSSLLGSTPGMDIRNGTINSGRRTVYIDITQNNITPWKDTVINWSERLWPYLSFNCTGSSSTQLRIYKIWLE